MKSAFQILARKNGALARLKAARVALILKHKTNNPTSARWLRMEAARQARAVFYHLGQAAAIGLIIKQIEVGER